MKYKKEDLDNKLCGDSLSLADQNPLSFAIFALARSHRALAGQMLREVGLFTGQEIILMQLWNQDNQSQRCLGQALRLDHSTIAKSVRRLEDAGLVARTRSKEDGRVTIVSLTHTGRNLETKVLDFWNELEKITGEGLTEQDKELLVKLSQKIASNIDNALEKP
ncbi:MarR family winged helix-turn-helix transcriptional regulator [Priestia megaterium]|uniref:MarR family winged helix-turn-helix transcriptional regulator n=1 Tax=Priestia megaterium TaxID=1404 RepID=UPI00159C6906|nr:MarR family winged helix-turn-helix transcriptional regulator [Priestia megaterium]